MLRILYMIPTLDRCGAEKQLTLLATRLPRDEFSVEVCALTRGGAYVADLAAAGVPVTVLDKRQKLDPVTAWKLGSLIRRGRFDIVHTWLFAANSYGRALASRHAVPVIVASERCADHWKGASELVIDRWLARKTDAIVANAQAVARFYESVGIDAAKLIVIPNGIVLQPPPTGDRAAVLAELNLPADARVLGFVGRLWPQKRVRDLIWAIELLHNFKNNAFALIVGDGPEREVLIDYAQKVRIDHRVRFTGPRDDVPRLLAAMDVFVLPSEFEGMANVLLEAMLAGLPVVASNIPGNDEVVVDGVTGFLVPVGDTKTIAARANRLLDDDALRQQFGAAGRQRVLQQFGVEKMVQGHVTLYRELAAKKGIGNLKSQI